MACRTLAQQIGALPAAGGAGDAADAGERLHELTLCGTRFLQGWLMQNAPPRNLPEVQVQMTLAACGWDWEAGCFEEGSAAMPSTVADAFTRLAELVEKPPPQPRRLIERPNRRARGAPVPAPAATAAATAAEAGLEEEAGALPSRAVAPDVTLAFSMAAFAREYARAAPRAPPARAQPSGATLADAAAAAGGEARLNSVPDAGCLDRATRVAASEVEGELTLALTLALTLTLTRCIRELLAAAPADKTAPPLTDESTEDAGSEDATEDALAAVENSIASGVSVEGGTAMLQMLSCALEGKQVACFDFPSPHPTPNPSPHPTQNPTP